jgi:hypothetical protein
VCTIGSRKPVIRENGGDGDNNREEYLEKIPRNHSVDSVQKTAV